MNNLKAQIKKLESIVKEYQEEPNELQSFILIAQYMDLLKTIPESKSFLYKMAVDVVKHANIQDPIFESMDNIPMLKTDKDGVQNNVWFYYSFLDMISASMNAGKMAHNLQDKLPLLEES